MSPQPPANVPTFGAVTAVHTYLSHSRRPPLDRLSTPHLSHPFFCAARCFHARLAAAPQWGRTSRGPSGGRREGKGWKALRKWISGAMEVAEASARACERRVTDGINHRCDRVRGGEPGRPAVSDGSGALPLEGGWRRQWSS